MAEFNVQMTPLFDMLRAIDTYVEQQGSWPTAEDEESMDVESAPTMEKKDMFHIAKPLPSWFVEPKINANAEEEGHFTTIRTKIATGPLSNSKEKKTRNPDDLRRLFIVHPLSLLIVDRTNTNIDSDDIVLHNDQNRMDISSNNY
jgi:hypothetical protein